MGNIQTFMINQPLLSMAMILPFSLFIVIGIFSILSFITVLFVLFRHDLPCSFRTSRRLSRVCATMAHRQRIGE